MKEIFLTLYFISWPNFIVWLSLLLEILINMFIEIICLFCDVISFEINHNFPIKPFFYITKKLRQKCKYLKNEKKFYHEIKSIFHHFYRVFNFQKLCQTREWTFKNIYLPELQLEKENNFRSIIFRLFYYNWKTQLYDKRDALPFSIVPMPHLDSNIPSNICYASLGSKILRFGRTTSFVPFPIVF